MSVRGSISHYKHSIIAMEREKHCYLVGRMSKKDTSTRQLAQELSERAARFPVLVYNRKRKAAGTSGFISPISADQNPRVSRSRFTLVREALSSQTWTIGWSSDNILGGLEFMHDLENRDMAWHTRSLSLST